MIYVDVQDKGYDIHIDQGLLPNAGALLEKVLPSKQVVILYDVALEGIYLEPLKKSLEAVNIKTIANIAVPSGEGSKSFSHFQMLAEQILACGVDRTTTLIALGGGVVGDLTGFLAASLLRGLPFVQIPTSLLAQVDSAVGGKTGINTKSGKNLIGAFHQPLAVITDIDTLKTLDSRELAAGYAEIVKYGFIDRPKFFEWLEENGKALLFGDPEAQKYAVEVSCQAKADIVAEDEKEKGKRALLNLGHTFGHALEAEAGYDGTLLHGEGVAIGMMMAFDLSYRLGLCPEKDVDLVRQHLKHMGLPTKPNFSCDIDRMMGHISKDKKNKENRLRFILVRGIGRAFQTEDVPIEDVRECLQSFI